MRRVVINLVKVAALAAVVWFLVIPQFGDAREELRTVGAIQPLFLVAGAALQVVTYAAHAQLVRALLPQDSRPPLRRMLGIELAGRAASHTIPAGTAAGAALSFRLLQRSGVRGPDAGFASATQAVGSAVVLHALTWGALTVSIPLRGFQTYYVLAAAVGVALIAFAASLLVAATKGEDRSVRLLRPLADRLPVLAPDDVEKVLRRLSDRVRTFIGDRRVMLRSAGWSALHWLSDAASLWVFLAAFGVRAPVDVVLVAFGIASMLATIPLSPRGLGFVEAGLITLFTALGLPRGEVVLGVIAYRLVSFWIPIPLGGASYLALGVVSKRA